MGDRRSDRNWIGVECCRIPENLEDRSAPGSTRITHVVPAIQAVTVKIRVGTKNLAELTMSSRHNELSLRRCVCYRSCLGACLSLTGMLARKKLRLRLSGCRSPSIDTLRSCHIGSCYSESFWESVENADDSSRVWHEVGRALGTILALHKVLNAMDSLT